MSGLLSGAQASMAVQAPFYMYAGPAFPTPEALLACRAVKRLAPLEEPMAQFYSEIGLYQQLVNHPRRVLNPDKAELFYVPVLPHLDSDAGGCNGTGHRARMASVASVLRASPHWQRKNGTDHVWACTCVMMKAMVTNELWAMLGTAMHAVHSVPRGHASPSRCQMAIPYFNPSFAAAPDAPTWRTPGRSRTILAHFRGRIMNRVRATLVRTYGKSPHHVIEAAHPSTAARCNLNKCGAAKFLKVGMPTQRQHLEEMTRSTFCIVPNGDSPPSSRLYLAVAAGCIPVLISDFFEGAFPSAVKWTDFTLRIPEGDLPTRNLTQELLAVIADAPRLALLQANLQKYASDVLWEAPGSRVGSHALSLATHALRDVCTPTAATAAPPDPTAAPAAAPAVRKPGPQVHFALRTT